MTNYFLHFSNDELKERVENIIRELQRQKIIQCNESILSIYKPQVRMLQLWSAGVREILQRYYITVNILQNDPAISRATLEKESQSVAQRLSVLHGINAPEFFDKAVFSAFIGSLKENNYFDENHQVNLSLLDDLSQILCQLISAEVGLTIRSAVEKIKDAKYS